MIISEVVTFLFYGLSMALLPEYFGAFPCVPLRLSLASSRRSPSAHLLLLFSTLTTDLSFVISTRFAWKVALIVAVR